MAGWYDFSPFVLPWAPSLPEPTLVHHVRQAAIRFFSESRCWREDLPAVQADGMSSAFELPIDDNTAVALLYSVTVNGTPWRVAEGQAAKAELTRDPCAAVAHVVGRRRIELGAPPAGAVIRVRAGLKPSQQSFELPDDQFEHHAAAIADGALGTLLALPGQAWTNPALAGHHVGLFNAAIDTANTEASYGNAQFLSRPPQRMSL